MNPRTRHALKRAASRLPVLGPVVRERDQLRRSLESTAAKKNDETWVPAGHFYSPVPSIDEVRTRAGRIFDRSLRDLPAIDLNEAGQLALLEEFKTYYRDLPFKAEATEGLRYQFENRFYSYCDAIFLHCMIRHLQPKRIIEVGSGFSSAVILDTNDLFFSGGIECTFIEPYPDVLRSLLKQGDESANTVIGAPVQDVEPERFTELSAGDILFIDSTHVTKTGSDVNYLFLEILPRLASGVRVHIHDVFYPFEYPESWVEQGRAWNEAYLLRAFLAFNSAFEISLFSTFLTQKHEEWFAREMPLCLKNPGGNIWLKRL